MTKAEGAALAQLLSVCANILEKCGAGKPTITLDKFEQHQLKGAHAGVLSMISTHRNAALEKLNTNNFWQKLIDNRNYQLELVDAKGEPLDDPKEVDLDDDDGIDPEDGEQGTLGDDDDDERARAHHRDLRNGVTASWPAIQGVPPHVQAGLIQALRDGSTKPKACDLVAKETGLDKFEVAGFFEELLKAGLFEKHGRGWIAHLPTERPPSEASVG